MAHVILAGIVFAVQNRFTINFNRSGLAPTILSLVDIDQSSLISIMAEQQSKASSDSVDILILGAGWTAQFLIPLLQEDKSLTFSASTRDGRSVAGYDTIKFTVDSETDWSLVPKANVVVLTFPTTVPCAVTSYVRGYEKVHGSTKWMQLGSTSIFDAS